MDTREAVGYVRQMASQGANPVLCTAAAESIERALEAADTLAAAAIYEAECDELNRLRILAEDYGDTR